MIASKSLAGTLMMLALLTATPAMAVINITSDEIWDGINNPHAADGVVLTSTGTLAGNNLVSTYTIPTGMTIAPGVTVYLHDIANPNTSSAINWNFNAGAGALTFADPTSTIDVTKGGRNNPVKAFTLNMNDNNITQSVAGAGRIINGVAVFGGLTGDAYNIAINSVGTASTAIGTIDVRKNDATGTAINLTTRGLIDVDSLNTSDISGGGGSGGAVNVTGKSLIIGDIDTRTFRTGGGGSMGAIALRGLGQPSNSVGDYLSNKLAENTVLLDGNINTNGPQSGLSGGNITVTTVSATLAPTFQWTNYPGSTLTLNVGDVTNSPGYTQGQMFINNSSVTPTAVNYTVFHDNFGPAAVSWATNTSGNWATATNWTPAASPNATNMVATIGSAVTSPQTIYLNAAAVAKGLVFDTTSKVAVAGTSALTLESGSGNASLSVLQGSHELQTQLTLNTNTNASASAGTSLDINGVLNLNQKTLTISGAGTININNTVTGLGSIANGGTLGTGGSTGLSGDLSSTGTLAIDIGGTTSNSYDSWNVSGAATLSGVLAVDAVGGFAPAAGQSFTILTASSVSAASLTLGGPDAGLFTLVKNPTSLVLQSVSAGVAGDYNHNGVVDAADYVVWRNTNGQNVTAGTGADGDGNGVVNAADYTFYRARFGNTSGSGVGSGAGAVPEPAAAVLMLMACLAMANIRRHS
jgi:hypothetical protein